MNEETKTAGGNNETNKSEEALVAPTDTPQRTNGKEEPKPKARFSTRSEKSDQSNDFSARARYSSAGGDRMDSSYGGDSEQSGELSTALASHFYNTDEADFFAEEGGEYSSDPWWNQQQKRRADFRLSLFDPKDSIAIELKTDAAELRVSRLPRLAPILSPQTSTEIIFNMKMFEDISMDTLETTDSYDKATKIEADKLAAQPKEDFFKKLGTVPEVDDIGSVDQYTDDYKPRHYVSTLAPKHGKFVDPLTGGSIDTIHGEDTKTELLAETSFAEEASEEGQESEVVDFEFPDFDALFPLDEQKVKKKAKAEIDMADEMMDIFAATFTEVKRDSQVVEVEDPEQEAHKAANVVECFLEDLLNCVTHYFQQREGDQYLREKLNKRELFVEIGKTVKEFMIERSVQSFLQRKIENYYRRKRQLRNITPERPEILAQEREKYREAINNLNHLLGREVFTFNKTTEKVDNLFAESHEAEKMAKGERQTFYDLVRKTLKRDNMPKLEALIEKEFEHISAVSDEISKVRAVFISRQHMLGTLKAQLEELENIGNGLRVADYEAIERQTLRLEKKIEEHNSDLDRFYGRFRNTIHSMAHSKIRNEMLVNCIKQQVKKLSYLDEEQNKCRLRVFELKKERQQIQHQISELSFQSGLLDKPAILVDYDRTVELIQKKRADVEKLREIMRNDEEKLKRAEAACESD